MPTSFKQTFGEIELSFENFYPTDGQVVYYVKPVNKNYRGFFMEETQMQEWKVVHRQIVPMEILQMEKQLSNAICQFT